MSWSVRRAGGPGGAPGRRVALWIAARDARRHPWRSLLVMLLVGLPVAVVSAGAILTATFTVDAEERAEMALGSADASLWHVGVPVEQARIPQRWDVWPVDSNDEESQAGMDGSVRGAVLTDAEVERNQVALHFPIRADAERLTLTPKTSDPLKDGIFISRKPKNPRPQPKGSPSTPKDNSRSPKWRIKDDE